MPYGIGLYLYDKLCFANYIDYKIMSNSICMIYYLAIKYNLYGTMNNYNVYL